MNEKDASLYNIPSPSEYAYDRLLNRIEHGEPIADVINELKSLTSSTIKSGTFGAGPTISGYTLTSEERRQLKNAVNKANENIAQAKQRFAGYESIFPEAFNYNDVAQNLVSSEAVTTKISDLALFTPENLVPVAVNETGEAGTEAERQYYMRIIQRENERRAARNQEFAPSEVSYLRVGASFDKQPIKTEDLSREQLKKRAQTWDDPARIYRSNLFLLNYAKALKNFETLLLHNGLVNDTVKMRLDYIYETLSKFFYNERAIDYIASTVPGIDINLLYNQTGEIDFTSIYEAWIEAEDMFL